MTQQGARLAACIIRLTLGICFVIHGWPKVFDLFGERIGGNWVYFVDSTLDLQPALLMAAVIALGEALAGTALVLGVVPKIAATVIIVIMAGAIWTVTGENGYSVTNNGFEYNLALIAMAVSVILTGPGSYAFRLRKKSEA